MSKEKKAADGKQQKNSRIWLIVSLVLTGIIMFWAFSLPFRGNQLTFTDPSPSAGDSGHHEVASPLSIRSDASAEEFRAAAIALDEDFMRKRRELARLPKVPGKKEAISHWNRHVKLVQKQIQQLGNPERGTLEWKERQRLIRSLADGPQ